MSLPSNRDSNSQPNTLPRTRDSNPTYKPAAYRENWTPSRIYRKTNPNSNQQDAEKARNPNPTYPPTEPIHQPEGNPESTSVSTGHNPNTPPVSVTNQNDKTASKPATSGGNAGSQPHASAYQNTARDEGNNCHQPDCETASKPATSSGNARSPPQAPAYQNTAGDEENNHCHQTDYEAASKPATSDENPPLASTHQNTEGAEGNNPCHLPEYETASNTATSDGNAGSPSHPPTYQNTAGDKESNPCHQLDNEAASKPAIATSGGNVGSPPHAASDENNSPCDQPDDDVALKPGSACLTPPDETGHQRPDEGALRQDDIQPYAIRFQEDDDDSSVLTEDGTENTPGATPVSPSDVDIEPYAVAYMGQEEVTFVKKRSEGTEASTTSRNDVSANLGCGNAPSTGSTGSVGNDGGTHEAPLIRNPMYAQDAQNPVYAHVPNVGEQATCGVFLGCLSVYARTCRRPVVAAVFALVLLGCGTLAGVFFAWGLQDSSKPSAAVHTTLRSGHPACCGSEDATTADLVSKPPTAAGTTTTSDHPATDPADTLGPSLSTADPPILHRPVMDPAYTLDPSTLAIAIPPILQRGMPTTYAKGLVAKTTTLPPSSQGTRVLSAEVVFGGRGSEPGKFNRNYGVAVTADSEIFVTDGRNQRVQVFSRRGEFLRLFPTVVPGGAATILIQPYGAAVDGGGNVWVVGRGTDKERRRPLRVVQYSKTGEPNATFSVRSWAKHPSIALDPSNNRVIVAAETQIFILQPNGSLFRRFGADQKLKFSYVATDQEGNILATETEHSSVHVYSSAGRFRFKFGGWGSDEGKLINPTGICVDGSGQLVLVSDWGNGRVDMFTRSGEFVRTVVKMQHPFGIALGPDGLLVVTNTMQDIVTIFPTALRPVHAHGLA